MNKQVLRILEIIITIIITVTRPLYESRLNWIHDPMPPATCRQDDLTSPAPAENTPPSEVRHKLPRRLRPRRRGRKQPATSANENSASRVTDPATPLGPSANENSPRLASSAATRPRSTANRNSPLPGPQPGTSRSPRSAFVKHPQSFQSSHLPQHPGSTTIPKASSPLICHSIPGQQPIKIEIASFAWTTLKSGVYINRPGLTPDRILQPAVLETPSPDLASPHLLSSNPPPNTSLDRLLGN